MVKLGSIFINEKLHTNHLADIKRLMYLYGRPHPLFAEPIESKIQLTSLELNEIKQLENKISEYHSSCNIKKERILYSN